MLDPTLPEKQRARRRLIGAIALVLAAVIILPMVLDSHPRPLAQDIAVDLPEPSREAQAAAAATREQASAALSAVAPDDAPASPATATATAQDRSSAAQGIATPQTTPSTASSLAGAAPRQAPPRQMAANAPAGPATDASSRGVQGRGAAPAASAAKATTATTATTTATAAANSAGRPGSRFIVQLGVFDQDSAADAWVARLKALGVPAYKEAGRDERGASKTFLRAGPFTDRQSAQAAVATVRGAGFGAASGSGD